VTAIAALAAGVHRSGATADLGLGGPPAARTTGPVGADRSGSFHRWKRCRVGIPAACAVRWIALGRRVSRTSADAQHRRGQLRAGETRFAHDHVRASAVARGLSGALRREGGRSSAEDALVVSVLPILRPPVLAAAARQSRALMVSAGYAAPSRPWARPVMMTPCT
jgi:hypothetical protein